MVFGDSQMLYGHNTFNYTISGGKFQNNLLLVSPSPWSSASQPDITISVIYLIQILWPERWDRLGYVLSSVTGEIWNGTWETNKIYR